MFNTIWQTLKARKHYAISWILLLIALGEYGSSIELSWSKFFHVLFVFAMIEYYAWAYKENK